jgi:hypothetical protein
MNIVSTKSATPLPLSAAAAEKKQAPAAESKDNEKESAEAEKKRAAERKAAIGRSTGSMRQVDGALSGSYNPGPSPQSMNSSGSGRHGSRRKDEVIEGGPYIFKWCCGWPCCCTEVLWDESRCCCGLARNPIACCRSKDTCQYLCWKVVCCSYFCASSIADREKALCFRCCLSHDKWQEYKRHRVNAGRDEPDVTCTAISTACCCCGFCG